MATLEEQRRFVAEEIARENLALFPNAPKETQDILRTYGQSPISATLLKTSPTIPILPQPTDDTNYNALLAHAQGVLGVSTMEPAEPEVSTDLNTRMAALIAKIGTPLPKREEAYQVAYQTSGIEAAQQEAQRREANVKAAQAELAGIQAQIQAVINKRDAQNLKLEQAASQGQVVGTILNRQQQEVNRQAAIEALPLQALALSAQAKVASLQGEAEYAQGTLKIAQDKLNMAFKLKDDDLERQYNYQKDARKAIWDFLTDAEKSRAEAAQKLSDRNYQREKDNLNNAQSIANSLMGSGQGELAAKITLLDPKNPKFSEKLAELQKQAQPVKQLSDFEQAFLRDKGRLPTVQELLNFNAQRKPEKPTATLPADIVASRLNSVGLGPAVITAGNKLTKGNADKIAAQGVPPSVVELITKAILEGNTLEEIRQALAEGHGRDVGFGYLDKYMSTLQETKSGGTKTKLDTLFESL